MKRLLCVIGVALWTQPILASAVSDLYDTADWGSLPADIFGHSANFVTDRRSLTSLSSVSKSIRQAVLHSQTWHFASEISWQFRYTPDPVDPEWIRRLGDQIEATPHYRSLLLSIINPDRLLVFLDRLKRSKISKDDANFIVGQLSRSFPVSAVKEVFSPDLVYRFFYGWSNVKFNDQLTLWDLVDDQHDFELLRAAFPLHLVKHLTERRKLQPEYLSILYRFLNFNYFEKGRPLFLKFMDPERIADPNILRLLLRIGIRFHISDLLQRSRDAATIRTCWPYLDKVHFHDSCRKIVLAHLQQDRVTDFLKSMLFFADPDHEEMFRVPPGLRSLVRSGTQFLGIMRTTILPNLINDSIEYGDKTLLHCAAQAGASTMTEFLLGVPDINLYRRDNVGKIALDYAKVSSTTYDLIATAMNRIVND